MKLVDEATGDVRWEVQPYPGTSRRAAAAMSPSGRFVVSVVDSDEPWTLLDAVNGAVRRVGARHDGTGACICREGHQSLKTCPVVAHTRGNYERTGVYTVAFSPCGRRFATGSRDRTVIMWDARTGEAEQRMQGSPGNISSLAFSADGARLSSASFEGDVHVWEATGALLLKKSDTQTFHASGQTFSPNDKGLLASSGSDQIHVWDVDIGSRLRSITGCQFAVFSPDGRTIATAGKNHCDVCLVDAESGAELVRMVPTLGALDSEMRTGGFVNSVSFSLDGSKLASGSKHGICKVWDSSTGALLQTIPTGWCGATPDSSGAGWSVETVDWGRDWVRDAGEAFAMGHHPRLGVGSPVLELEAEVVRMILDRV